MPLLLHPPLEGEGRRASKMPAGVGVNFFVRRSPHPDRSRCAQAVDPPPPGEGEVTPGTANTKSVNAFPRTSKFGYWSNEAQAGESRITGSLSPEASASRVAASIAAGSTPYALSG